MQSIRESILENRFAAFVVEFMCRIYPNGDYDEWVVEALASVNIALPKLDTKSAQRSTSAT
jgi:queuine tRNA-ribosyltransferase